MRAIRVDIFVLVVTLVLLRSDLHAQNIPAYLGFDRNEYPGDVNLKGLRQTFSYSSYWLNNPPGERNNSWPGIVQPSNPPDLDFLCCSTDVSTPN